MNKVQISASILSADFTRLGEEVNQALAAGVDWIHFDVMDHHFVPNLSFGPVVCQSMRAAGISAPIDVHLMVEKPEQYIEPFAKAGANLITFHPEACKDVEACLHHIRAHGMKTGLALNPDKSLGLVQKYLANIDLLLLMSVYPGFAGQSFIRETIDKIRQVKKLMVEINSKAWLGIDGGIKNSNIGEVTAAGADFCIIGSGLFHADDYSTHMRDILSKVVR